MNKCFRNFLEVPSHPSIIVSMSRKSSRVQHSFESNPVFDYRARVFGAPCNAFPWIRCWKRRRCRPGREISRKRLLCSVLWRRNFLINLLFLLSSKLNKVCFMVIMETLIKWSRRNHFLHIFFRGPMVALMLTMSKPFLSGVAQNLLPISRLFFNP